MARKSRKSEVKPQITPSPIVIYNTALYVRLSLMDLGKTNNDTVINQEGLLRNYVEEHPELSLKDVFVDNGETGVNFDRPAWNDLMRECRRGEINCIVIKDLSRLGRNYIETGDYLERVLPVLGVRLIAVNDRYDSINLSNGERLVSNLKNLVNDIYAKDISRKVSAAFHTKQKKGVFIGNQAPYGYEKPRKNIIVPNPETAPIVRKIFKWKAEGFGTAKICEMLEEQGIPSPGNGLWHRKTVKNILQNPVYLGHMAQGKAFCSLAQGIPYRKTKREEWVIVQDTHEPIVSRELYDEANAVIDARKAAYDERNGNR